MKYFNLLLISFIVILISCKPKLNELPKEIDVSDKPDLTIYDFKAFYKYDNRLKAEAFSPIVFQYTRSNVRTRLVFPDGLKVDFYDENLEVSTYLVADSAVRYENDKFWKFEGHVVIKNQTGAYLKTNELFFYEETKKLYSKKYVEVINTDGTVIRGKGGFEANIDFTSYQFKNVDGIIKSFEKLN